MIDPDIPSPASNTHTQAANRLVSREPHTNAVPELFWDYCHENPGQIAIVDLGSRVWSRREVGEASLRVRHYLAAQGIEEGAAVAILSPNCAEFMAVYLGITLLGAMAVPVNFHLTADEILHVIRTSSAASLIVHESMYAKALEAVHEAGTRAIHVVSMESLTAPSAALASGPDPVTLPANLGRTMLFTSGTTGKPKAISYPRGSGYESLKKLIAFREARGSPRNSNGVHFCASTLFHAGPLEGTVVTLHMGNTVVIMRRWDVHEALEAMARYRVTECFIVPVMMVQLAKLTEEERSRHDLSSLRTLVHAGAPCPPDAKRKVIEWLGPIVCEGYGASEGGGTFVTAEEWLRYPGTVGRPIPGAAISVRSPKGEELPTGQAGLVYIRAYTGDRFEYAGDPEATRKCYVGDQFTVGDVGYLNAEGYLFLLDRAANLIVCGGTNVYPAEIEAVLSAHARVLDCAVIGRPHPLFGETVHAIIQAQTSADVTTAELRADIIKFAYQRLAPNKLPRSMEFVDSIPRTPNGKLMKRLLANR